MKLLTCKFVRRYARLLVVLLLPVAANGQVTFKCLTNLDETIDIQFCFGPKGLPGTTAVVPDTITGRPVTQIGINAFGTMTSFITNIVIPDSVHQIDANAFLSCRYVSSITVGTGVTNLFGSAFADIGNGVSLTTYPAPNRVSFYFSGNAPALGYYDTNGVFVPDETAFDRDPKATIYYLAETTGWSDTLGAVPTALWLPQVQPVVRGSGGTANQMTLNVFWAKGKTVVLESCTDLLHPAWQALATNTLTTTGTWSYSDQNWTTSACGFYRVRAQ
jgi:hypothetical protein